MRLCSWLWSRLIEWMRRPRPPSSARSQYQIVRVDDDPELVKPRRVYVIGENGHSWHATLLCPCGCGERLSLNLLPDDSPCWVLLDDGGVPTLHPSIWRRVGCRSHFFLRGGRIRVVRGRPTPPHRKRRIVEAGRARAPGRGRRVDQLDGRPQPGRTRESPSRASGSWAAEAVSGGSAPRRTPGAIQGLDALDAVGPSLPQGRSRGGEAEGRAGGTLGWGRTPVPGVPRRPRAGRSPRDTGATDAPRTCPGWRAVELVGGPSTPRGPSLDAPVQEAGPSPRRPDRGGGGRALDALAEEAGGARGQQARMRVLVRYLRQ